MTDEEEERKALSLARLERSKQHLKCAFPIRDTGCQLGDTTGVFSRVKPSAVN